jgi:flagellar assembly factor FliW
MGKLLIFIDESGTMPLNKEKDIFVAAGIGVFENYPIFTGQKGKKPWLIGQIVKHSAIPFISYIDPDAEYYTKIQKNLIKLKKWLLRLLK